MKRNDSKSKRRPDGGSASRPSPKSSTSATTSSTKSHQSSGETKVTKLKPSGRVKSWLNNVKSGFKEGGAKIHRSIHVGLQRLRGRKKVTSAQPTAPAQGGTRISNILKPRKTGTTSDQKASHAIQTDKKKGSSKDSMFDENDEPMPGFSGTLTPRAWDISIESSKKDDEEEYEESAAEKTKTIADTEMDSVFNKTINAESTITSTVAKPSKTAPPSKRKSSATSTRVQSTTVKPKAKPHSGKSPHTPNNKSGKKAA